AIVYIPLFAQGVIGMSATGAGIVLMPFMLCWTLSSIVGGRLALRWGYRPVTAGGMLLLVSGFVLLTRLTAHAPIRELWTSMTVLGLAMGLTATMFMIAMQNAVPSAQRGLATSVNIFVRNIGSAIGVSLQGAVLIGVLTARIRTERGIAGGAGRELRPHHDQGHGQRVRPARGGAGTPPPDPPGAPLFRAAPRLAQAPPTRPPPADPGPGRPRAGRDPHRWLLRTDPRRHPGCGQARPDREAHPDDHRGVWLRPRGPLAGRAGLGAAPRAADRRGGRAVHHRRRHPLPRRGTRGGAPPRLLHHRGGRGSARDLPQPQAAALPHPVGAGGRGDRL